MHFATRIMPAAFFTLSALFTCGVPAMVFAQPRQIIRTGPDLGLPFSPAVKAGGFIYVSGTLATDASGKIIAGDVQAQTRQVLGNVSSVLKSAGSSLANAASVMVYLKNAADFAAMNEVYRTYWPKDPPARTTIAAPLVIPEALVEISLVAVPEGGERMVVRPRDWLESPNPYSYGIKSGSTLFLAGLVSRNGRDNSIASGDIAAQTKTVLDNGAAILKEGGFGYGDVVSARVFVTDVSQVPAMNAAYRSYFPANPPARATVKAGLMGADYKVEITLVAVKDGTRTAIATPNADGTAGQPSPAPLSSAIRVGDRLFVSGILGATPSTRGDTGAQTQEALARIGRTLKAAGFDWQDIVDAVVYLPDLTRFGDMNGAYRDVFRKDFPARATIGCGLVNPDGLVEIMMVAQK